MSNDHRSGIEASWRAVARDVVPSIAVLAGGVLMAAAALRTTPIAVLEQVKAYLLLVSGETKDDAAKAPRKVG